MAKAKRAGINFAFLMKICLLGAIVMLCWNLAPAAQCSFRGMNEADINENVGDDDGAAAATDATDGQVDSTDVTRVSGTQGFFGKFFGSIGPCYSSNPITTAEVWKQYTLYGFAGGFVLFLLLGMIQKPKSYSS